MLFGLGEDVHEIQDVALKSPGGEPLALAYKTTTRYFIGGLYVRDDGYVLRLQSDTARYLQLPNGDELLRLQQQGLLPDPLPPYQLGAVDYANGYSLWMIVALTPACDRAAFDRQESSAPATDLRSFGPGVVSN